MALSAPRRLRAICLALPEAEERETFGAPTYRVRDRIFAMERDDNGRIAFWCKAPRGSQEMLVESAPGRFYRPPYVGRHGWIGMWLDAKPDWDEVAALVRRSYAMTAPKRLAATMT